MFVFKPHNIEKEIIRIISYILDNTQESVKKESNIRNDFGADSLDLVEITLCIEEEFDIDDIPDEDLNNINTVQDVINYVSRKLEDKNGKIMGRVSG